ncbi:MAG: hypothetical protein HIU91_04120 [Acidobacteria bacterium]|nr:hypothetical protein [Acidobacteriota bacterium]
MKRYIPMLTLFSALLFTTAGCVRSYPPPPPPPAAGAPPLVQQAERNGFEAGHMDGVRDAQNGLPPRPRAMRAYRVTPGYFPQMGSYPVYRDAFRNAYLRGYHRGYYPG